MSSTVSGRPGKFRRNIMRFKIKFNGRKIDAIGITYPITEEVEADSAPEAREKLYEKYDTITNVRFLPEYEPIASGGKEFEGGESWVNWWLFRKLSERQVREAIEELNIGAWYGGPGRAFSREPYHSTSKSYTLIKQYGGLDI
jgi:hypothetical protein